MFKTMRTRKGVTLAEITVALALVATMITLVVSFVMIITERTKANALNDAMRRDCELIESVAESWMNNSSAEDIKELKGIAFYNGTFTAGTRTVRTESVKDIEFYVLDTSSDILLICTITCANRKGEDGPVFKICINSRVGDAVIEEGSEND